jgi:YegS/Rv2252/BmrU family lipid kinase
VPTRTCAIVNPNAGGGRLRRQWPGLLRRLLAITDGLSVQWTTGPRSATAQTRAALRNRFDRILAIGGDGTLHEVVNGFFEGRTAIAPEATLVHLPFGTGVDFRRSLDVPTGLPSVAQLTSPKVRRIDLIRALVTTDTGPETRYVANIASFGLGGLVVQSMQHLQGSALVGGRLSYLGAILRGLAVHTPPLVDLAVDDAWIGRVRIHNVAVANGHTFGGGLQIAPCARIDDGRLDVVVLRDLPIRTLLRHAHRFYRGTHPGLNGVEIATGQRVAALPVDAPPVPMDLDGESLGRLPAVFELVPDAIRVQG